MRLSLIVPCFNEQDNIFPFARAVAEVFPTRPITRSSLSTTAARTRPCKI